MFLLLNASEVKGPFESPGTGRELFCLPNDSSMHHIHCELAPKALDHFDWPATPLTSMPWWETS